VSEFDTIVVGLGGAGSSAAYHLASRNTKLLGLEQFGIAHAHGSSHGQTRIYRTAYAEGPEYVPLLLEAQRLWRALEKATGEKVFQRTGGLFLGRPTTPTVAGAVRTATTCHLDHEVLSANEIRERFPQFRVDDDEIALWDPNAGVLFPEMCIRSHSSRALESGAELHFGEAVQDWTATSGSVEVRTRTSTYRARSLVLTAGPWTSLLAGELDLPLEIERQFMFWFPPKHPDRFGPDRLPVFLWDKGPSEHTYGVPDFGNGVKIGSWAGKVALRPEEADRVFRESEATPVRSFVERSFPGLTPRECDFTTCLYTNAPDHRFLIGRHPRHANVVIVSACSGHGFKFTSVLGLVIARLVHQEETGYDLSPFDPGRFRPRSP